MANALIELKLEWREVETTCEICAGCGDKIYGKQYQLFIEPGGATDTILCESCRSVIEKDSDGESFDINL